jgi:hypothetical protein
MMRLRTSHLNIAAEMGTRNEGAPTVRWEKGEVKGT